MEKLDLKSIDINGCIDLIGAIIRQAINDLSDPSSQIKDSAVAFLRSERYMKWCSTLGVNPLYILEAANRHNGGLCIMKKIIQKISNYQRHF